MNYDNDLDQHDELYEVRGRMLMAAAVVVALALAAIGAMAWAAWKAVA